MKAHLLRAPGRLDERRRVAEGSRVTFLAGLLALAVLAPSPAWATPWDTDNDQVPNADEAGNPRDNFSASASVRGRSSGWKAARTRRTRTPFCR